MCFPVRKKSGRSSLALAVWNSSLSLNLHSSSSSSLPTVCLKELRSALMTHRVAPTGRQTGRRGTETLTMTWNSTLLQDAFHTVSHSQSYTNVVLVIFFTCTTFRHSEIHQHICATYNTHTSIRFHCLYLVCLCTFEERELLEEARSHKGVGETEEKATEQQARGADVDGMRSGTHKTHRHLQERQRECDVYIRYVEIQGMVKGECFSVNKYAVIVCVCVLRTSCPRLR